MQKTVNKGRRQLDFNAAAAAQNCNARLLWRIRCGLLHCACAAIGEWPVLRLCGFDGFFVTCWNSRPFVFRGVARFFRAN